MFNQTSTSHHWERDNGNHTYKVVVDLTNPRNISILTTKVNNSTAREQRETAHCHNNLTTSNVLSKIKQALKL